MNLLRKMWTWWCRLWGCDFFDSAEVDSHKWENKAEMFRRLSHGYN